MSCRPYRDIYVLECSAGGCTPSFRAHEIPSGLGHCARRLIIKSEIPPWMQPELQRRAVTAGWISGVHKLKYSCRFGILPESEPTFRDLCYTDPTDVRTESFTHTLQDVREDFEQQVSDDVLKERFNYAGELFLGICQIAFVYLTSRQFWRRLLDPSKGHFRDIAGILGLQALAVAIGLFWFLLSMGSFAYAIMFFVPVILLAMLIELLGWFILTVRRRRQREAA